MQGDQLLLNLKYLKLDQNPLVRKEALKCTSLLEMYADSRQILSFLFFFFFSFCDFYIVYNYILFNEGTN